MTIIWKRVTTNESSLRVRNRLVQCMILLLVAVFWIQGVGGPLAYPAGSIAIVWGAAIPVVFVSAFVLR